MADNATRSPEVADLTRRDVLRAGAGAGVLGIAAITQGSAVETGDAFVVKPYLQLGDAPRLRESEQMVVMWHSIDRDKSWTVEYRNSGAWTVTPSPVFRRVAVGRIDPHRVFHATLADLMPGQPFEYRVKCNGDVLFSSNGRARKSRLQPVRCVVMGDCGTGSPEQKKVAFQVSQTDPDFVLIPGDIVYNNGLISEYRPKFFPVYSPDVASPEAGAPLLRSVPFLGGLGQHDTGQTLDKFSDGFAYYMYWSFPLNGPVREPGAANAFPLGGTGLQQAAVLEATGDRYPRMANYSFDYGDSHWVVLDTWNPHIDWNDPRLREWLRQDLANANTTWKFVSSYLPPFNSSTAYPHTQKMRVIADIIQAAEVDIVFCGYAHSYQVTYPLKFTPATKPVGPVDDPGHEIAGEFEFDRNFDGKTNTKPDGVLYITTGGGGNPGLHSPEQTDNSETWQPFTCKYNASVNQFSDVQIDSRRLTLRQIDLNGNLIDQIVITK
jgi:hypothetical protein